MLFEITVITIALVIPNSLVHRAGMDGEINLRTIAWAVTMGYTALFANWVWIVYLIAASFVTFVFVVTFLYSGADDYIPSGLDGHILMDESEAFQPDINYSRVRDVLNIDVIHKRIEIFIALPLISLATYLILALVAVT